MAPEGIDRVMQDQQLKDHWVKRGIAYIIDSIIILIVVFILIMIAVIAMIGSIVGGAMTGNPVGGVVGGLILLLVTILIAFLFSLGYWVYFDAKGGTPGKKIMNLKPVAVEGEMSYGKALTRNLAKILGGLLGWLVLGLILGTIVEVILVALNMYLGIARGGDPRRKYTDYIAGTTVIRTDVEETFAPTPEAPPAPVPGAPSAPASETPTSSITEPSSPAPEPVNPTSTSSMSTDDKARLDALRDKFLMGEITEEQYLKARKNISGGI